MRKSFTLNSIKDVVEKRTLDGREYVRVAFNAFDENEVDVIVKISMSINQWKELKNYMIIKYDSLLEEITSRKSILLEFNSDDKTTSKKPKLIMEHKIGAYNGYAFNYYELNVGLLITHNIVSPEKFKKDYGKLF